MEKIPSLSELFDHTTNNDLEILQSHKCSCLFCRHTIDAREVQDWVNDEQGVSAICPECGMDTLIGDASGYSFTKEELREINTTYFGEDFMERHPEAAKTYCERYREGKITNKAANELLYIQYLSILSRQGDPESTYDLANLLEFGSQFTQADPKTAFSFYASRCLEDDARAYTRMGVLCESGVLGKKDLRGAFECYSKAMAFGDASGLLHFSDCYLNGVFVEKNPGIAYSMLLHFYPECNAKFMSTTGKNPLIFASLCYRIGCMNQQGLGIHKSPFDAMLFLLMADNAYMIHGEQEMNSEIKAEFEDCYRRINELAKILNYTQSEPTFDIDTFGQSLLMNAYGNFAGFEGSTISRIEYDRETKTLSFVTSFGIPQLIIDAASIFCRFVADDILWRFNDVAEIKYLDTEEPIWFNRCRGDGEEGFTFSLYRDGTEETVFEIKLAAPNEIKPEFEIEEDEQKGVA